MEKDSSRFAAGVVVGVLCLALSLPAFACKSDYCNGSLAPTNLNQVNNTNNNNNNNNTPPTGQQVQQCMMYDKQSISGTALWGDMQNLPALQQFAFYTQVMGSGNGQNDLFAQVLANMFGGDMVAYNTWVNDNSYGTNGYVNNIFFNPATGTLDQTPGGQVGQVPGWTCPYYP